MAIYHHYDGQGNTLSLTDDTQTRVVERFTYTAFGERLDVLGDASLTPFQWNGRWGYYYDEDLGEYHVRARPYGPAIARWLAIDPIVAMSIGPEEFDIFGENQFKYAYNNPCDLDDPSGNAPERCCVKTFKAKMGRFDYRSKGRPYADKPWLNGYIGAPLTVSAEFDSINGTCRCCEYRQFIIIEQFRVRMIFRPPKPPSEWITPFPESFEMVEDNFDRGRTYGHRTGENRLYPLGDSPTGVPQFIPIDWYYLDRANGCTYRSTDFFGKDNVNDIFAVAPPGAKLEFQVSVKFYSVIIDTCLAYTLTSLIIENHVQFTGSFGASDGS